MRYHVCSTQDVPQGEKRSYTVKNIPLVVIHSARDEFYAIYRFCPHQRGDLFTGILGGQTVASQPGEPFKYEREGEILRCPWHSFSYDVTTGACLTVPEKLRVKTYPVIVEDQQVFLDI
ncbi:MAG TPA: Rieske 2Fe-2S domain-containing protein [Ktedonobacteraceae bacterium]|jgi:3-phenylpropionate/trans-cinnamate dioxygenase ferredoxin subunit|nr:Rieske 2Fe-2S domain-containing protein [Ktedonobacteraceae bacterium]